ncbi:MAG TPA: MFS transporter, partial [Verrucomicrobiae bacterium]|nr:MFS transporter [Verrucomicrobiae bacterium]
HLREALDSVRYTFVENRRLRWGICLGVVMSIASFYPVWLIQPYMRHAGVPLSWFGPVWAGANLTVALFSLLSHRVHDALGDCRMILLFGLLIVTGYLGLGLAGGMWGFLFYYLLTAMRGLRGPMMLHHIQKLAPSANRAGILSLQSLAFRLLFACTGPAVGAVADRAGVQGAFRMLCLAFLLALPPLSLLFLRSLAPSRD